MDMDRGQYFDEETSQEKRELAPVEIQKDSLSVGALEGIIESYILREGTDYGAQEISLDKKKEQIGRQIDKKDIRIVFDFNTESVTLMTSSEWTKLNKS